MKRGAPDAADGAGAKKARADASEPDVLVYAPCVVPALKKKMNSLVEVLLPSKYLSGEGKPVKLNQLWGTDVYSDDSDLVAVLVHTGHLKLKSSTPKTTLLVSLRVCPPPDAFVGSERNGIRSREWAKGHGGVAFKVERCLQQAAATPPTPELSMLRPSSSSRQIPGSTGQYEPGIWRDDDDGRSIDSSGVGGVAAACWRQRSTLKATPPWPFALSLIHI